MTIEEAIVDRLVEDTAVAAIVGGRVWLLVIPQHAASPSVKVQQIDEPRRMHLRGHIAVTRARIQIDAYGKPSAEGDVYREVAALADAIEAALGPAPFAVSGSPSDLRIEMVRREDRRSVFEPPDVRMSLDLFVEYRKTG